MIICKTCSAMLENGNMQFCPNCGARINAPGMNNQFTPNGEPAYFSQQQVPPSSPVQYQMRWYKFLINFALFFSAFLNFIYGFNYITGGIYAVQTNGQMTAEMVYSRYGDGLKILDVGNGMAMLAMAAFGIYTRFRLAKYKANAPMCLYILYGANLGVTLLYNVAFMSVADSGHVLECNSLTGIISSIAAIILNYIYFNKRKALFIN